MFNYDHLKYSSRISNNRYEANRANKVVLVSYEKQGLAPFTRNTPSASSQCSSGLENSDIIAKRTQKRYTTVQ